MRLSWPSCTAFAVLALGLMAGCMDSSRKVMTTDDSLEAIPAAKLPELGDPIGPLDEGRVMLSPPAGWHIPPRTAKFVARFQANRKEQYPAILITAENYEPIYRVSKQNVQQFAKQMAASLKESEEVKLVGQVKPLEMEGFAGVTYQRRARDDAAVIERRFVETVLDGRKYAFELRVPQGSVRKYWPHLLAVVKGMEPAKESDKEPPAPEIPKPAEPAPDVQLEPLPADKSP